MIGELRKLVGNAAQAQLNITAIIGRCYYGVA